MKLDESTMNPIEEWAYAEYMHVRAGQKADHEEAAWWAAEETANRFELDDEDMYNIFERLFHAAEDWAEWDIDVVRGWLNDDEMSPSDWLDHFFSSAASDDQRVLLVTASRNTQADAEAKLVTLGK